MHSLLFESNRDDRLNNNGIQGGGDYITLYDVLEYPASILVIFLPC